MMIDLKQILQSNGYAIFHIDSSVQNKNLPDESRLSMMVLCEDGSAVLEGNMQRVTLTKGSRLLGAKMFQTKILEVSPDFQAWVLLVADSKRVTEASKGALRPIGNRPRSVMAQARLTGRHTGRPGRKLEHSDPVVPHGRAIAQRIKGTPGITG